MEHNTTRKKQDETQITEKINIESNESTRELYQNRQKQKVEMNKIESDDDVKEAQDKFSNSSGRSMRKEKSHEKK